MNASKNSICPYCGVGCQVSLTADGNTVISVKGAEDAPANKGKLCPKGILLNPILSLPGRLLRPQVREHTTDAFVDKTWDETLTHVSDKLHSIIEEYGPDSVALYGSGQLDTEAWYLGNKLFKGYIGSNHVDSNSRLCMASAVAAYRSTLGSDAPPTCYDDIQLADCFLIVGSNMADTHPVLFQQVKARRAQDPKPVIIVVDPRFTHTAQSADLHIPLKPGSDIAFFNLVARILMEKGATDNAFIEQHTNNFNDYASMLGNMDMELMLEDCGVPLQMIERVADAIATSQNFLSFYCMGLGQSSVGTAKNQSLIDLHLLTGQIGKPGAGPFSLTGQVNAMGGRELGGLAHLLPGYRLIENAEHRRAVERLWNVPEGRINPRSGLTAVEIFQGLESGRIKAIWIVCNNPMVSLPNLERAKKALSNAELVIAQDCFETETTKMAHVVLPAAQWVEKTGTITNSERRVTRTRQLVAPPEDAKPDWWIFDRVAQRMGYEGFGYDSVETIWDEYRTLTAGTVCDQYGITNERLAHETVQWPCPSEDHPGTPRRYLDRQFATPNGRANFVACNHAMPKERVSREYPFTLTTGRLASQWHTMTRTGKVQRLASQASAPYIEIHDYDAALARIKDGDAVRVSSPRGSVTVSAKVSRNIMPGVVFMPFHWGDLYSEGNAANKLTNDVLDGISKEPEFKACAVQLACA